MIQQKRNASFSTRSSCSPVRVRAAPASYFPFYEWDEEEKKVDFAHNPFSMPQGGLEALETQDPLTIKAFQYDMVCNGYELASGSIRNQHPDLMVKAFELTGLTQADVEERFGGMYRAFQYGAPPHADFARHTAA